MSKLFKTLLLLAVLVAVAAGLYALARNGKGNDNDKKLVTVEKGSITEKAVAVGQIQPRQKFSIKSKISGIVKRCMVNVGDTRQSGRRALRDRPRPHASGADRRRPHARLDQGLVRPRRADFERAQELVAPGILLASPTST